MFFILPCSCRCIIHWSQELSREWGCSWSSANRQCSNYIWVIINFIAYWGVIYTRGLTMNCFQTLQAAIWLSGHVCQVTLLYNHKIACDCLTTDYCNLYTSQATTTDSYLRSMQWWYDYLSMTERPSCCTEVLISLLKTLLHTCLHTYC